MKLKYQVTVRRNEYREHTFEVEANSREEAEDKALEASSDHDYSQNTVHYTDEEVVSAFRADDKDPVRRALDSE